MKNRYFETIWGYYTKEETLLITGINNGYFYGVIVERIIQGQVTNIEEFKVENYKNYAEAKKEAFKKYVKNKELLIELRRS